jgi:hypothetical protein
MRQRSHLSAWLVNATAVSRRLDARPLGRSGSKALLELWIARLSEMGRQSLIIERSDRRQPNRLRHIHPLRQGAYQQDQIFGLCGVGSRVVRTAGVAKRKGHCNRIVRFTHGVVNPTGRAACNSRTALPPLENRSLVCGDRLTIGTIESLSSCLIGKLRGRHGTAGCVRRVRHPKCDATTRDERRQFPASHAGKLSMSHTPSQ